MNNEEPEKKNYGGRNLIVLGVGSILIALVTSLVSLYVYHKSGDIYLDCSLPDADCPSARANSEENNREEFYTFSDNGTIDKKVLDEYLKELDSPINRINKFDNLFDSKSLSDESLGI